MALKSISKCVLASNLRPAQVIIVINMQICNANSILLQTIKVQIQQDNNDMDLTMHANFGGHVTCTFCILSIKIMNMQLQQSKLV